MPLKLLIFISFFLPSIAGAAAASEPEVGYTHIRVLPETQKELESLSIFEPCGISEIPPHRLGRAYDFEIPNSEMEDFNNLNISYETLPRNRNVWNTRDFFSYQEIHDTLSATVAQYPNIATMENLGVSTRDGLIIWALKLSDNPQIQEDEPDVLLNALIHAREPVSASILMGFIEEMTTGYGVDAEITTLVNNTEIWIIPILNPEGYLYVETGIPDPWWRKNKRENAGDDVFSGVVFGYCGSAFPSYPDGVDLNRNYKEGWQNAGSDVACSLDYRGPYYFSENESLLEKALFEREQMVAAISFHSYSEYVGYCGSDPAGLQLCQEMADSITKESGSASYGAEFFYGYGQSYNWMYWELGVQAYLVETGTEFFPTGATRIDGIVGNNLNGIRTLLNRVHGAGISGHVFDATNNEPLVAEVIISGEPQINQPRMSEPLFGRFSRLTLPGSYTVTARLAGYHDTVLENIIVNEGVPTPVDIPLINLLSVAPESPALFSLKQNYPNPFNPSTSIEFDIDQDQRVRVLVYDMSGRQIAILADQLYAAGAHHAQWDGRDSAGLAVSSGTYLVRFLSGEVVQSRKIMLVR